MKPYNITPRRVDPNYLAKVKFSTIPTAPFPAKALKRSNVPPQAFIERIGSVLAHNPLHKSPNCFPVNSNNVVKSGLAKKNFKCNPKKYISYN